MSCSALGRKNLPSRYLFQVLWIGETIASDTDSLPAEKKKAGGELFFYC